MDIKELSKVSDKVDWNLKGYVGGNLFKSKPSKAQALALQSICERNHKYTAGTKTVKGNLCLAVKVELPKELKLNTDVELIGCQSDGDVAYFCYMPKEGGWATERQAEKV